MLLSAKYVYKVYCMQNKRSAFAHCHPAVNLLFFLIALLFSMILVHPAYVLATLFASALYCMVLKGFKGVKLVLVMLPLLLLLSLINPLLNTSGVTVLLYLFGRPYTREALFYGMCIGGMFVSVVLWFFCYNEIMTSDKFTAVLANFIPALSLLLVMVLRLVPDYARKAKQLAGARGCIGLGAGEHSKRSDKLRSGASVLSALLGWALESSVQTADSMRSRGYGAGKRSCFHDMHFSPRDALVCVLLALLALGAAVPAITGTAKAVFIPELQLSPISGARGILGLSCYTAFLLLPSIFDLREEITWRISISKI